VAATPWSIDPIAGLQWRPPEAPTVETYDLDVPVERLPTARTEWRSAAEPQVFAVAFAGQSPRAVSVPIAADRPPKTRSFLFEASPESSNGPAERPPSGAARPEPHRTPTDRRPTYLRPPGDVIKLADRLGYVLQPPIESLLAQRCLRFPFEPFPFQYEGVAFLYPRHRAVLADEMGLGKTMQAITAIRLLLHRGELRRVLLVCPKSLVANWQREFRDWAPEVTALVIEGAQEKRRWQWLLPDVSVKIANYELLHRDQEVLAEHGPGLGFDLVVLDEAQRIKNRRSATSQAAATLGGRRRWALTGTPVENSPEDLVGIFEFLAPGLLSPEMRPRQMGRAVGDDILRRTKEQVLRELPPKLFRDAEIELTPEQQAAYQLAEDEGVVHLGELGAQITIRHVFELVLRLKQICNFDPATGESAKLERLDADLEEVAESGRKAIVFSQWVRSIEQLRGPLQRFGPLEYHGRIAPQHREAVIRRFRDDPDAHVLLLSYGAGGVGLNLQFAGYVFLFDRWWNPAVEDQAINRVHRIGSSGPITVTRFLTPGTIEERIDRILEEKRELFDAIFRDGQPRRRLGLSQEEIFGLFDLSTPPRTRAARPA
jgi:SNF2 family DNA or RNA helicase